jgi:hypothetical protein
MTELSAADLMDISTNVFTGAKKDKIGFLGEILLVLVYTTFRL